MRAVLLSALALALLSTPALALPDGLRLGGDVSVFLREEAAGNRSVLPGLTLRGGYRLGDRLELAALGMSAWSGQGIGPATASTFHQRLAIRPEYALPVRSSAFVFAAGPALSLVHNRLYDRGEPVASTTLLRPGLSAAALFEVALPFVSLRTGCELLWAAGRTDVVVGIGALWPAWSRP